MIATKDEIELLEQLKNGDHRAFEQIYHLYKVRMIANLLRLLKSRDLAEEVLQELFIKVWTNRQRIDTSQPLNAYLYKVAANMSYDVFRKISRDQKLVEQLFLNTAQGYDHIESYIFRKENNDQLSKALELLPPQQQKVFVLCKLEDKSYEEAGRILNVSVGTINNHLYRANLFLKDHFAKSRGGELATTIILSAILNSL